jgi:hypothetical protein
LPLDAPGGGVDLDAADGGDLHIAFVDEDASFRWKKAVAGNIGLCASVV